MKTGKWLMAMFLLLGVLGCKLQSRNDINSMKIEALVKSLEQAPEPDKDTLIKAFESLTPQQTKELDEIFQKFESAGVYSEEVMDSMARKLIVRVAGKEGKKPKLQNRNIKPSQLEVVQYPGGIRLNKLEQFLVATSPGLADGAKRSKDDAMTLTIPEGVEEVP
jgi:hypothetical protein